MRPAAPPPRAAGHGPEGWVLAAWYGGEGRTLLQRVFVWCMAPLGWMVGRLAARRRGQARRSTVDLPPVIAWLAAALRTRGLRVGLVSRGHGRQGQTARRVSPGDLPALVGDEPAWLAASTGVPVAVGRDRRAATGLLAGEVDLVLADDGLQHHSLPRCLEVIVVDVTRPWPLGNGRCLPAGPLREPVDFVGAAQVVLCNHGIPPTVGKVPATVASWAQRATVLHFGLRATAAVHLRTGERRPLSAFGPVLAVAGIGNPQRFFDGLVAAGVTLGATRIFPDHHAYVPEDFRERSPASGGPVDGATAAIGLPVLMTAKDAVKCAAFAADDWWRVDTELAFAPGDDRKFMDRVLAALGRGEVDDG
jgi:tetraacyldisaccharide 4'-kinase